MAELEAELNKLEEFKEKQLAEGRAEIFKIQKDIQHVIGTVNS